MSSQKGQAVVGELPSRDGGNVAYFAEQAFSRGPGRDFSV